MTILEIFVAEQEYAFVCGAWGHVTVSMIEQIELEVRENPLAGPSGKESVFVKAEWIEDEYDYIGGVRMVINAGYWDLTLVDAPADYATLRPASEWKESDGPVLWWMEGREPYVGRGPCALSRWSHIPKVELPKADAAKENA